MSPSSWIESASARRRIEALAPTIAELAGAAEPTLGPLLGQLALRAGKRLRPGLLLVVAGDACRPELAMTCAAAVELIHVASLHHDDVMDRAPKRRGGPSSNARWGNELATLSGTVLSMRAAQVFARSGDQINRVATRELANLGRGQMLEATNAYNLEIEVRDHLEILELKTASLFRLACSIGASLGGRSEAERVALSAFATALGVAFQLLDDVDDLRSEGDFDGKLSGRDLGEGVYGLAVILAARSEDAGELRRLLRARASSDVAGGADLSRVPALVEQSGGLERALEVADGFLRHARASARELSETLSGSLLRLCDLLEARRHG